MPDRPIQRWCRAATPEECDFPAGCSACAAEKKKLEACPFCEGRATKLLSLTTGMLTCQQCGQSYEVEGVKQAVDEAIAKTNAEFERRYIHGEGTATPVGLLGRSQRRSKRGL